MQVAAGLSPALPCTARPTWHYRHPVHHPVPCRLGREQCVVQAREWCRASVTLAVLLQNKSKAIRAPTHNPPLTLFIQMHLRGR